MAQEVESLFSECKALSSNPHATKKSKSSNVYGTKEFFLKWHCSLPELHLEWMPTCLLATITGTKPLSPHILESSAPLTP
jgi:hypothetical protein